MSNVFGGKYKVTVWFSTLESVLPIFVFTSKTADCGTDLVKDVFTEHLALLQAGEIYIRFKKNVSKSLLLGVCIMT